ncbi:glycosyltransferase [Georgenia sp. Z1344]|uniref:glycosyltransferase n=1 Tax=Georgenia sp. Z1344 TaxID=3416706 RepID=UPI003CF43730
MTSRRPRVTIASRIWSPEPAAASFRLAALARGLREAGAATRVLTARPPADATIDDHPGTRVSRAPVLRDADGYLRGYVPYLSFDVPLSARLLRDPAPDVYVVEPPPTTGLVVRAVAAIRRRPYVAYVPDIWSDAATSTGAPGAVVEVLRRAESAVLAGAAATIAVSDDVAARAEELGARGVVVVRGGADTETFTPAGPMPDDDDPRPYLLYAGTASEWQGADVFLRALPRVLEQVPDARVVVLGQGSAWPELERLAARLPSGAVELRGLVGQAEAARWQRGARAALVSIRPGIGYDLAYPTKAYAAWASGVPVIYAGPGPARADIAESRLGWAVEHDADDVARAMVAALTGERGPGDAARLAGWVAENASSSAAGRAAADVALGAIRAQSAMTP